MKKSILTILMAVYIGVSTGIPLNVHYCMGRLVEVDLWQNDMHLASCKENSMCNGDHSLPCCSNKVLFIKIDMEQNSFHEQKIDYIPIISTLFIEEIDISYSFNRENPIISKPLTKYSGFQRHIINCAFLI